MLLDTVRDTSLSVKEAWSRPRDLWTSTDSFCYCPACRWSGLWSVRRLVWRVNCYHCCFFLECGDILANRSLLLYSYPVLITSAFCVPSCDAGLTNGGDYTLWGKGEGSGLGKTWFQLRYWDG